MKSNACACTCTTTSHSLIGEIREQVKEKDDENHKSETKKKGRKDSSCILHSSFFFE
jgi:hypothetical protein